MNKNIDVESNKIPLLQQKSHEDVDLNGLTDAQEKILESFRIQANAINKRYPKNSPLNVIEAELIELFNNFLYEWPDDIWKKHDKKKQNLIENIYYSLVYADFKFTTDELQYLLDVWNICKQNGQAPHNNSNMIDSMVAFKILKLKLIDKKVNIKSTNNRKEIDKRIRQINMNCYAVESLLNTLLHRKNFEIVKAFFLVYEKQTTGISVRSDIVYHKIIERVALDLSTGSIETMETEIEFFHFLLDHDKVGKNYIIKTATFKELQRLGAKRTLECILYKKPFLGTLDEKGELAISGIGRDLLERLFNSLIEPQVNNKRMVEMDLGCFIPSKEYIDEYPEYNEMKLFYHIAEAIDLRPLLAHPVVETLITLKYKKLSVFNWDLILWRIVVLTVVFLNYVLPSETVTGLSWTIFAILLVSEFYAYFESPSQIRIFLFGFLNLTTLTALFMFLHNNCVVHVHNECPNITGFGSILLAINVTFIMCFFSRHISVYVFMLFNVARNAFRFILAISIMMLGFAYCLSKNLGELDGFELTQQTEGNQTDTTMGSLVKTIFKTFVMLSGELEARELPYLHHLSYFVFLVFVFFVPIVSLNLLSGLAVGDVQEIKSNATLWHLTTITMFLYWYEKGIVRR